MNSVDFAAEATEYGLANEAIHMLQAVICYQLHVD